MHKRNFVAHDAVDSSVLYFPSSIASLAGKKTVKLEVRSGQKSSSSNLKSNKRSRSSGLEFKLDELRKELASLDGGIFPHSVLSTQQISMLSDKKPKSMEEVQFTNYNVSLYLHVFSRMLTVFRLCVL